MEPAIHAIGMTAMTMLITVASSMTMTSLQELMCCACGGGVTAALNLLSEEEAEAEKDAVIAKLTAAGGGLNLSGVPLAAPEWEINLDQVAGEEMATGLMNEYEEWGQRAEHIANDWNTDRELVDTYYWKYEMEPHL